MSNTPRTDAIIASSDEPTAHWEVILSKMTALAKELELENAQLKEFLSPRSQEIRDVIREKLKEAQSEIYAP